MVVAGGVEDQLADQLAGVVVDDADVEVVNEQDDAGAGERGAEADVVQPGVVAQGDAASAVDPVVPDASPTWSLADNAHLDRILALAEDMANVRAAEQAWEEMKGDRPSTDSVGRGQGRSRPGMTYTVALTPAATRQRKFDPQVRRRLQAAIELLANDPQPPAATHPSAVPASGEFGLATTASSMRSKTTTARACLGGRASPRDLTRALTDGRPPGPSQSRIAQRLLGAGDVIMSVVDADPEQLAAAAERCMPRQEARDSGGKAALAVAFSPCLTILESRWPTWRRPSTSTSGSLLRSDCMR